MNTITRRLEFDAAHRVLGHGGKCRHLHGHRYTVEITVQAPELNDLGMVVDFSIIKERVGKWIDIHWDHNIILHLDDPQLPHLEKTEERIPYNMGAENPTAENMARHLFSIASELLPRLKIVNVRVYETPNCWADYTPGE